MAGAEVGDALGGSLALGDVNGDGVVDMVVGAAGANGHGTFVTAPARPKDADIWYNLGEAYIVFGGPKLDCLPRPVHTAGLKATRSGDNVNLKWDTASDAATAAYDVWSVQDQDKGTIRLANRALQGTRVVAACTPPPPLASPQCTDAGAMSRPPALVFYQVRPTCADGTEGLDGAY